MRQDIVTLGTFPFHVYEPLVLLTVQDVQQVLARWADGHIDDEDPQAWADALEVRYDIDQSHTSTPRSMSACSSYQSPPWPANASARSLSIGAIDFTISATDTATGTGSCCFSTK